ncbi:kinase-like domain-containing protein [Sphaerosporella brunnea]|uniref:non-specific serine/threonine protein kinase n=1 Tax=Sphaerosporella brunnea TaxID=1250544 RepID=A0A5J5EI70_9PEZI|nr:kinase-like domain-containing protein [Sphaerosporella brunnea]
MSSWKLPKSLKQHPRVVIAVVVVKAMLTLMQSSRRPIWERRRPINPVRHLLQTITQGSLDKSASSSSLVDGTATSSNPGDVSPSSSVKPGLLIVTLHEAKDLTLPSDRDRPPPEVSAEELLAPELLQLLMVILDSSPRSSEPTVFWSLTRPRWSSTQLWCSRRPVFAGNTTQFKFDVSREAELSVGIYMRNPGPRGAGDEDVFLGSCRILPSFEEPVQGPRSSSQPRDSAELSGFHSRTARGARNQDITLKMSDFELMTVVGKGSFGKVMQVKKRDTQRIYALKTIRKQHIISRSEVNHTLAERTVLAQINNPFIVPLKFSFQSPEKLYLVLAARFYTAELLCALECLHGFNVIYRDLKPENILLDYTGHIALCDFGLSFCGTPEYLAPELLLGQGYTKSVDWWTLGVLLYEMLTGLPPFYDENTNEMYKKILQDPLQFPPDMDPHAKSLLIRLLDRDPAKRLGANGAAEIKSHRFFETIDWRRLLQKKIQPTFRPNVLDAMDTKNFDPEFTQEMPADSVVDGEFLSQSVQQQFTGWSYNRPGQLSSEAPGSIRDPGHL